MNWAGRRPISSATRSAAGWRSSWNAADGPVPSPASPPRADGPAGRRPSSRWSPSSSRGCRSGCSLASWAPARCGCPTPASCPRCRSAGPPMVSAKNSWPRSSTTSRTAPPTSSCWPKRSCSPDCSSWRRPKFPPILVLCGKDRVFPAPRSHRYFQAQLPASTRITEIAGVGHIPMFEAPGRVTEVIDSFLAEHRQDSRAVEDPPAS